MPLPFQALSCPLDALPLQRVDACWRCASGHSFDIAAQNYVNLLAVQHKRSRDPGDSKEMILARQRFLQAGHYLPIAQAVSRIALDGQQSGHDLDGPDGRKATDGREVPDGREATVGRHVTDGHQAADGRKALDGLTALNGPEAQHERQTRAAMTCLDAGCGEGYYLRSLLDASHARGVPLHAAGLDISKWAIMAAARRDKRATWLVGTNAKLPVQSQSLDLVLCMFGFPVYPEFARVLKPGGRLVQVDAGPDHLRELREIIYPTLRATREDAVHPPAPFEPISSEVLRYDMQLDDAQAIADLLVMTPHFYRASGEGRSRAAALEQLTTSVDVTVTQWRAKHPDQKPGLDA